MAVSILPIILCVSCTQATGGPPSRSSTTTSEAVDRILSRSGAVLAESVATSDPTTTVPSYPNGPLYASVTGFDSPIYGRSGLEDAEHSLLSGSATVTLTISDAAQQAAYKAMAKQKGAVVAIDPSTGALCVNLG